MTSNLKKILISFLLFLAFVLSFSVTLLFAAEGVVQKAQPLSSTAVLGKSHIPVKPTVTCSECHDVKYDAKATATKMWINNYPLYKKDEVWKWIVDFLPDRERFVVATVGEDSMATASTVDFVLVPEERIFLCVNEKGTEKVLQLEKNPWVSMVHYEGSIEGAKAPEKRYWKSVQVFGKAKVIEGGTKEFEDMLAKYKLARTPSDQARKRFNMLRVEIYRIITFNSENMKNDLSPYQIWENERVGLVSNEKVKSTK